MSRLLISASKHFIGPRLGGFEATFEAGIGSHGARLQPVVGAYVGLPWLTIGSEYAGPREKFSLALSLRAPERRGGYFRRGDMIRVDYHTRRNEYLAGVTLRSPFEACRLSRPRRTGATLPNGSAARYAPRPPLVQSALVESTLDAVRHSVFWLERLLTPHFEDGSFESQAAPYRDHIRIPGHTFRDEDARYHDALDAAFTLAMDGDSAAGLAVAAVAESVVFRDVLVPFNRLFGQEKSAPHAGGFCVSALEAFEARLVPICPEGSAPDSTRREQRSRCREIFRRTLVEIEKASADAGERWKNAFLFWSNRGALAWLPLNYGLRPEQYDTQAEWDSVLAAVTGEAFRDANDIEYLMLEQFHLKLKRMIRETRRYQVTIVHDFRGQVPGGAADRYGWDLVLDGYLAAFTNAVHELNAGDRKVLPQYFLFLDANYYEENGSRGIISYLENLYDPAAPALSPPEYGRQIAAAQSALAESIRSSPSLRGLGKRRLRETFRVHVNITNGFDPSFGLDVTRRDHRKVAFADVSERDPGSGSALVAGQGIGEHYNDTAWEDRSLLVRGPSLVRLKTAARDLVLQQGFRPWEVPECLRATPYPDDYEARCAALRDRGWRSGAAVLVNETGYGVKESTVLKAAIYNLAPAGSVLLSYDSLWISDFWAGMFLCAALRGASAFPVGPTPENAPSAAPTTLYFLRETLHTMFEAGRFFREDLERAGGHLRVGIYAQAVQTDDFGQRIDAFLHGAQRQRFLQDLFPVTSSVIESLKKIRDQFPTILRVELQLRPRPFLHMKSQFFGTAEAFRILRVRGLSRALERYMAIREKQAHGLATDGITPALFEGLIQEFQSELDSVSTTSRSRVIYTLTTGSHNQNLRSMLLDGEVLVAVSGYDTIISFIDTMFILFVAEWPSDPKEFDRLFPRRHVPFYLKPILGAMRDQS